MASSRRFAALLAEQVFGGGGEQFVELALSLRITPVVRDENGQARWDAGRDENGKPKEEEVLRVGGRWDRVERKWVGDAAQPAVIRIPPGGMQEKAARWLARWFRAHVTGDWSEFYKRDKDGNVVLGPDGRPIRNVWFSLFLGGRRSGKSWLAVAALAFYLVAYPGSIVWAVSPTQDETAELETAFRKMVPATWYTYRGAGTGKVSTFTMITGAELLMLSGFKADGLRRGRVDLVLYNEAQNMTQAGYVQVRAPIADTGGMVIVAANPPSKPIGRWVDDMKEGLEKGAMDGVLFEFNPEENPWVEMQALYSMQAEVDEVTYDRDVLGLSRPIGDVVFHAWQDRFSKRPVPLGFVDITEEFTREKLGRPFPFVVGMDFQLTPHMAAAVLKFFRDPEDPTQDVLTWVVGEVVVPNANEDELVTALECADRWTPVGYVDGAGYTGDECAVVMDASGWFQDGEHTKGKTSDLALKARGWRWLYKPQKDSDRNPEITERVKAGNARLKTKDQRRHMWVVPECVEVAKAMKYWERKNGVPYRKSIYAHICDAVTYPIYRFFGRPTVKKPPPKALRVNPNKRINEVSGW